MSSFRSKLKRWVHQALGVVGMIGGFFAIMFLLGEVALGSFLISRWAYESQWFVLGLVTDMIRLGLSAFIILASIAFVVGLVLWLYDVIRGVETISPR